MKKNTVSVIIPVYNAESTIGNILNKLLIQNYRNIEIIAINDGSQDSSLEVLSRFHDNDSRVVVINQDNKGASAARNTGLVNSSGEYVTFVDSDDDIDGNLIVRLVDSIRGGADIGICGMNLNEKRIVSPSILIEGRVSIVSYTLKSLLTKNILYGPCCKIFRRSIIDKGAISFPEDIGYGEDTIFVLDYLREVSSISNIDEALYYYHYSSTGLARRNSNVSFFREARNEALKKFMLGNFTVGLTSMYLLVRGRWGLARLKNKMMSNINRG